MLDSIKGKIKDGGKCVCDICGKTAKLGGLMAPMSDDPKVACYDCMIKISAKEQGLSIAEARKQREKIVGTSNMFNRVKIEEYLAAAGKDAFDGESQVNEVMRYIMNVWNSFDKNEKEEFERKSKEELAADYAAVKMSWQYFVRGKFQGRNDPCACGSGKKYKKCCLIHDELAGAIVEEWKKTDMSVIRKAMRLINEDNILDTKLLVEYFWGEKRMDIVRDEGVSDIDEHEYNEWLMNDYYLREDEIPFILGKLLKDGSLSEFEQKNVESRIEAPKSIYAVTWIKKGTGALLRDVFTHEEKFIYDRKFSDTATDGMLITCRILDSGQYNLISGAFRCYPNSSVEVIKNVILDEYTKRGHGMGVQNFLRKNGEIFGRLYSKLR